MSGQKETEVVIDAKFLGLLGLCLTQLALAIWWAGEKSAEITHLQADVQRVQADVIRLTDSIDAKMQRIEAKIDAIAARH